MKRSAIVRFGPCLLLLCLWVGLSQTLSPVLADSFQDGLAAYQRGAYAQAAGHFALAVRQNPASPEARFRLGLALARNGQYDDARTAFDWVTQHAPPGSELHRKAVTNLTLMTQAQVRQNSGNGSANAHALQRASRGVGGSNYLSNAIPNGRIIHWNASSMPLRVYIESGKQVPGWTPDLKPLVKAGWGAWTQATYGKIKFLETLDPAKADIRVSWRANMEHGRVGVNPFQYTGDTIVRSDIVLATHTSEGQRLSKNQIQGVATHELGHAIGIQGHSPYPEDLMYWAVNDAQTGSLTTRDKNTIRLLYKIDADIQNHAGVSTAETRNVYDGLGKAQALMSQGRPAEAVPLLQQAIAHNGRDARLHAALGLALQQSGNATGAMQSYRQALNLDDTLWQPKYNLAGLLHNEGVRLAQSGHVSQARTYFQQTVSLYEQVQRSGEAPAEIGNALSVARKNLSLTNP